jgi:hypothetical protein
MAKSGITKIKINGAAVAALLRSPEVRADLEARGARIAAAAGEGVEAETLNGGDRVSVVVSTRTQEARRNEAEDRSLTRAIDAGR